MNVFLILFVIKYAFAYYEPADFSINIDETSTIRHARRDDLMTTLTLSTKVNSREIISSCYLRNKMSYEPIYSASKLLFKNGSHSYLAERNATNFSPKVEFRKCYSKYISGPARLTALKKHMIAKSMMSFSLDVSGVEDSRWMSSYDIENTYNTFQLPRKVKVEENSRGKSFGSYFLELADYESSTSSRYSSSNWTSSSQNTANKDSSRKGRNLYISEVVKRDFKSFVNEVNSVLDSNEAKHITCNDKIAVFMKSERYKEWVAATKKKFLSFKSKGEKLKKEDKISVIEDHLKGYISWIIREKNILAQVLQLEGFDIGFSQSSKESDYFVGELQNLKLNETEKNVMFDANEMEKFDSWQNSSTKELEQWLLNTLSETESYNSHLGDLIVELNEITSSENSLRKLVKVQKSCVDNFPFGMISKFVKFYLKAVRYFRSTLSLYRDQLEKYEKNCYEEYATWKDYKTLNYVQNHQTYYKWRKLQSKMYMKTKKIMFTFFNNIQKDLWREFVWHMKGLCAAFSRTLNNIV